MKNFMILNSMLCNYINIADMERREKRKFHMMVEEFHPIKLNPRNYIVLRFGNRAIKLCTETVLIANHEAFFGPRK